MVASKQSKRQHRDGTQASGKMPPRASEAKNSSMTNGQATKVKHGFDRVADRQTTAHGKYMTTLMYGNAGKQGLRARIDGDDGGRKAVTTNANRPEEIT